MHMKQQTYSSLRKYSSPANLKSTINLDVNPLKSLSKK